MKTCSRTHDFESYLYWWAITGASVIRGAGEEENKAIKGECRRRRVTNLILTKLKGYSTQNSENYDSNFSNSAAISARRAAEDPPIQWCTGGGIKTKALRVMMTKTVLYFISSRALKKGKSSLDQNHGSFSPTSRKRRRPRLADGGRRSMLMEWPWTTIMTVRSDGRTRRHMSVLHSSNVQPKLLLCVNKEDRKWQFGSSNQECHSQLHPLPAPDTSRSRRGHGSDSSSSAAPPHPSFLICSLLPVFFFFFSPAPSPPPMGHSISMPPTPRITVKEKTEWCTEDTSRSDGGTFFEYSNKTQGLSCQITLTPSVKIPATSLRERRSRCPGFAFLFWTELSRFAREGHWRRRRWKEWALGGSARLSVTERAPGVANYGKRFHSAAVSFMRDKWARVLLSVIHVHLLWLVFHFVLVPIKCGCVCKFVQAFALNTAHMDLYGYRHT